MARKVIEYVVSDDNRDKGKTFVVTEMPASKGEMWAIRVMLAISGLDIGNDSGDKIINSGMSGLSGVDVRTLGRIDIDILTPILEEMFQHIEIQIPDGSMCRRLIENDIEEITTRLQLRKVFWELHLDFLQLAAQ